MLGLWCAGHAHIDMNWMRGMPETVGITIDTFQTVLNLMKEYPQFVFSQSRASAYEIIEKYCPSMLPEIRERIHEGRWEITASQWVEGDKNMAGTEALCRHLLYTKEYLSKLFDIDPNSMADSAGVGVKEKAPFAHVWKKVLFNHFHDILPGSGIPETCQYSLGIFREALSAATANANRAMRAIAEYTDTTLWGDVYDPESQTEGGGVGAGVMQNPSMDLTMAAKYDFGTTGRAGGSVRPYTLQNPTQYDRDETTEISVWDWPLEPAYTEVTDSEGNVVPFTVMSTDPGKWAYMGHKLMRIAFRAMVPAYGFANYYVRRARNAFAMNFDQNPRTHTMQDGLCVLENEKLKACFDSCTLRLVSLTDKKTGKEMLSPDQPSGTFRLIEERTNYGYSAWVVGDHGRVEDILENNLIRIVEEKLDARNSGLPMK